MLVILILIPGILSFARINLGVHYPSDCIAGVILGFSACMLGRLLILADNHGCSCDSTFSKICYPNNSTIKEITPTNLELNWIVVSCLIAGQLIFALLCILKPIQFWVKFGAIFGLLFPALTFRLVFLCPLGSPGKIASLNPTITNQNFDIVSFVYGLGVVIIGMAIGIKLQQRLLFWVFMLYWLFYIFVILFWRLYIQYRVPKWP